MTAAIATYYDVSFDGDCPVFRGAMRRLAGGVALGLGTIAAIGVLGASVTLGALWIVSGAHPGEGSRFAMTDNAMPRGPRVLTLAGDDPRLTGVTRGSPDLAMSERTPQMQFARARALALTLMAELPQERPRLAAVASVKPPAPVPLPPVRVAALAPERAPEITGSIPEPRGVTLPPEALVPALSYAPVAVVPRALEPKAAKPAGIQLAHNSGPALAPDVDSRTAVYDISARTVYMPNGDRLEAHSGLGDKMDDPKYVNVRMRGATPPNVYTLTMREQLFHGVRAIRLNPVDDSKMFGRDGILAHTYMLGPNGQSNGCVSFKNYDKFLQAFLDGHVDRMVVVTHMDGLPPSRFAQNGAGASRSRSSRARPDDRYANISDNDSSALTW